MGTYTIKSSIDDYLKDTSKQYSPNTLKTYRDGLENFCRYLLEIGIVAERAPTITLSEELIISYFKSLTTSSTSTIHLNFYAVTNWLAFLHERNPEQAYFPEIKKKIQAIIPKPSRRKSPDPDFVYIYRVIDYVDHLNKEQEQNKFAHLRNLRDRALVMFLAETGLDSKVVRELKMNQVDLKGKLVRYMVGQEEKTAIFSQRTRLALEDYLKACDDEQFSAKNRFLFGHHRARTEEKNFPLSPRVIYEIVRQRASEALGSEDDGSITPISLKKSNIQLLWNAIAFLHPKIVAKCHLLFESGQYDEAILNAMKLIEEEVRKKISSDPTDTGMALIGKAFKEGTGFKFSDVDNEQQAAQMLYKGAVGYFRNPRSHRFLNSSDPREAFEILAYASLLLRMLDEIS